MIGVFFPFIFEFLQQIRYFLKLEIPFQIVMVEERSLCLVRLIRIDRCENLFHFIFEIFTFYRLKRQIKIFQMILDFLPNPFVNHKGQAKSNEDDFSVASHRSIS